MTALDQPIDEAAYQESLHLARAAYGMIARGSSDRKAIRALQERLSNLGFEVANDGIFGPETEKAVKAFQQSRGAAVDGIVGPETLGKLLRAHKKAENPADSGLDAIERVVLPGMSQRDRTGTALGRVKAEQNGGGAAAATGAPAAATTPGLQQIGTTPTGQPIYTAAPGATTPARQPGQSAQAHRATLGSTSTVPKGPNGGRIDPVTGHEIATSSTGPIGSTQVQQPSNMTFEQAHPRGPGGQFIAKGSSGKQVSTTQHKLNMVDQAGLKEDGDFGVHTEQKVRAFQQKHGLEVDGIVGPHTRKALNTAFRKYRAKRQ